LPELYVFLGCLVYMGVHPEHDMEGYWRTKPSHKGPVHELPNHIGSTRFFQIRRNLTLVDRGDPPYDAAASWFQPIESLVYHLREAFKTVRLMEELHTDSIDGGSEAIDRPGHVPGRGRTPTLSLAGALAGGRQPI
jgi:hypothetical protein